MPPGSGWTAPTGPGRAAGGREVKATAREVEALVVELRTELRDRSAQGEFSAIASSAATST